MFGFKKSKADSSQPDSESKGLFASLKSRLGKTRSNLTFGLSNLLLGKKKIDDEVLEELEEVLLMADVGMESTTQITENLTQALSRKSIDDESAIYENLKLSMLDILEPCHQPLQIDEQCKPFVILMAGINGAGKTTTIGKLAQQFKQQGKSVILAAGDTFRAAAVEQLQTWGQRLDIPVISQGQGADAASVIYDALQSAIAHKTDILIADTAGRLHTQDNLMNELIKIQRVMTKLDPEAPHETMLVLDAGTGQNALSQAKHFNEALNVSGITLTKLDGTAKGGIVFSLAKQLGIPIRFIGVGESAGDLRVFDAEQFIDALLAQEDSH